MQVIAASHAGGPGASDRLVAADLIPDADVKLAHMGVKGLQPQTMIDDSTEAFEKLRQSLSAPRLEHRALTRDCPAVRIPSGEEVALERDDEISIIRESDGAYIIQVPVLGGEYRIEPSDADALGKSRPVDRLAAAAKAPVPAGTDLDQRVRERLCEVYDPELPLNIPGNCFNWGIVYASM